MTQIMCPKCKSKLYIKKGVVKGKQRYLCKNCKHRYRLMDSRKILQDEDIRDLVIRELKLLKKNIMVDYKQWNKQNKLQFKKKHTKLEKEYDSKIRATKRKNKREKIYYEYVKIFEELHKSTYFGMKNSIILLKKSKSILPSILKEKYNLDISHSYVYEILRNYKNIINK